MAAKACVPRSTNPESVEIGHLRTVPIHFSWSEKEYQKKNRQV